MAEPIPLSARLPRMKLESGGGGPHDPGMEARLAVLEEIAKSTKEVLGDIRVDLRGMREESRSELRGIREELRGDIRGLRSDLRSDFRWLLSLMIAAAAAIMVIVAHGFHWF